MFERETLPSPSDLFGSDLPFLDQLVISRMVSKILDPIFPLKNQRADPEAARGLFQGWHVAEERERPKEDRPIDDHDEPFYELELMARLPHHAQQHPAARTFGSIHLYGGRDSDLAEDSVLVGPLIVGSGCKIRSSSRITGPIVIGKSVYVGGNVTLSRSFVGNESRIESGAIIGDTVIGSRVRVGASVHLRSHYSGATNDWITMRDFRPSTLLRWSYDRSIAGPIIGNDCIVLDDLQPGTVLCPGCYVPPHRALEAGIYTADQLPRY